jgi:gluconate 2-dehydrogenase alpha chain
MKSLPAVDVVIVGGGWCGLLMAKELGARTSLSIVVLERGEAHKAGEYAAGMDELEYAIRFRMMQDLSQETVTLRRSPSEGAAPLRQHGCFLPGSGVGGAGEHWSGHFPRMIPDNLQLLSRTLEKYPPGKLPGDHSIQDWGVTYDELEPHYTRAENLLGISGKAGNLRGTLIDGGNIFEGWRSTEFPTPPTKIPYVSSLFRGAAKSLGYHPYPIPAATTSVSFTNPDGVSRPGCTHCGFCLLYGCMIGAKAQPTNTLLPVIHKQKNVSIRTGAWVRRIIHSNMNGKGQVRGVSYMDASGEEIFQPAALTILASWTFNNTRLLLLSGLGEPYDPITGKGNVGRNLTHQVLVPAVTMFFEKPLNRFMGSAAAGIRISDFDGDLFDHSQLPFLRGGNLSVVNISSGPIANFGVLPPSVKTHWGSEWKKAALHYYDRTATISFSGEHLAYKGNFMDLDPNYKDHVGDPLLRLTLDWRDNERKMAEFAAAKAIEMAQAMGAKEIVPFAGLHNYDARKYQSTHLQGGAIMGSSPEDSVVNPFLQHWQTTNLFILGASSFPQNSAANPTATILALVYRTTDGIVNRYLKNPELLA